MNPSSPPAVPAVLAAALRPTERSDLRPAERNGLIGGVVAVHALALWGLLQVGAVQDAVRHVTPLMVDFISVAQPPKPAPPPPTPAPQQPIARAAPVQPSVIAAAPVPADAPTPFVVPPPAEPAPVLQAAPTAPQVAAAPAPAPPAPPPPAPPQPRLLPASNIAYLVAPLIELPLASRRLGEQGLVLLRVLVGVDGLPRQVSVQRSSGFARLDEQAVSAMKRARFKPQTDQGTPIEWIVIAPLQYEIE